MPIDWASFNTVPAWVILPNLDPVFFYSNVLSLPGNAIRTPVCTDKITASSARLSYAQLLIEVELEETFLDEVLIDMPDGSVFKQRVDFEWLPSTCRQCKCFGHCDRNCPANMPNRQPGWPSGKSVGENKERHSFADVVRNSGMRKTWAPNLHRQVNNQEIRILRRPPTTQEKGKSVMGKDNDQVATDQCTSKAHEHASSGPLKAHKPVMDQARNVLCTGTVSNSRKDEVGSGKVEKELGAPVSVNARAGDTSDLVGNMTATEMAMQKVDVTQTAIESSSALVMCQRVHEFPDEVEEYFEDLPESIRGSSPGGSAPKAWTRFDIEDLETGWAVVQTKSNRRRRCSGRISNLHFSS